MLYEEVPRFRISKLNPIIIMEDGSHRLDPAYSMSLYVRNVDEVARQINEVKTANDVSLQTNDVKTTQSAAAAKRIFVSVYSNPTDFKIVMLNGSTAADWNRFLEEARSRLFIPYRASNLQVMLYQTTIAVKDQTTIAVQGKTTIAIKRASELEAGDKVVFRY